MAPKLVAFACVSLVLSLGVAACGGSETSAEEEWASSVCTSIETWKSDIQLITTGAALDLRDLATDKDELSSAAGEAVDATQALIDSLKELGPPEIDEADEAQAAVDGFLGQAQTALDDVSAAAAVIPDASSIPSLLEELSGLATSLQAVVTAGQALIGSLEATADDLRQGFEDAPACDDLRGGS